MYCPNCGKEVGQFERYCLNCGTQIYPENKDKKAKFASAGLAFGIMSTFIPMYFLGFSLLGLIFSSVGLKSTTKHKSAVVGLVFSIINLLSLIILILSVVLFYEQIMNFLQNIIQNFLPME